MRASEDGPDYGLLALQTAEVAGGQPHWVTALSNASALMAEELPRINWVGFYLLGPLLDPQLPSDVLFLGPFQGRVACTTIRLGTGVCGTSAAQDRTLRVDDVHAFPGHIACDAASASELVVPLHAHGHVAGVLDIDSPDQARFSAIDQAGIEAVARAVEGALEGVL